MILSLIRLLGVLLGVAGLILVADDRLALGAGLVVAGMAAVIATARLPFRQFGPWRPHVEDEAPDAYEERLARAEQRLKSATPGSRRNRETVATPTRGDP